jgi:hypothetical protein
MLMKLCKARRGRSLRRIREILSTAHASIQTPLEFNFAESSESAGEKFRTRKMNLHQ